MVTVIKLTAYKVLTFKSVATFRHANKSGVKKVTRARHSALHARANAGARVYVVRSGWSCITV